MTGGNRVPPPTTVITDEYPDDGSMPSKPRSAASSPVARRTVTKHERKQTTISGSR